jgi:hypothetical protein
MKGVTNPHDEIKGSNPTWSTSFVLVKYGIISSSFWITGIQMS